MRQKKLEELMYLSLISKFSYKQIKDGKTYYAFNSDMENNKNNLKIKPIYITGEEMASLKVQRLRIKSFENKILNKQTLNALECYVNDENEVDYLRRIMIYKTNVFKKANAKQQKEIYDNFTTNMWGLYNFNIINNKERKACVKYIQQELKTKELSF